MALPAAAYPGLALASASTHLPGPGTHQHNGTITASLAGTPSLTPASSTSQPALPTISVSRGSAPSTSAPLSRSVTARNRLPTVSSTVLARVTRLQRDRATVAIVVVDDVVCADSFSGVIRREDIRGWEIDKVVVGECFRVGDIVRASVISLGDQASYYLSTARNELGVLMATSEEGNAMFPVSWKEFRDEKTGKGEGRKVAKPV